MVVQRRHEKLVAERNEMQERLAALKRALEPKGQVEEETFTLASTMAENELQHDYQIAISREVQHACMRRCSTPHRDVPRRHSRCVTDDGTTRRRCMAPRRRCMRCASSRFGSS